MALHANLHVHSRVTRRARRHGDVSTLPLFPEALAAPSPSAAAVPKVRRRRAKAVAPAKPPRSLPALPASVAREPIPGLNAPPGEAGLDADQLALVVAEGSALMVAAGPGAGKTRALVERALHLIGQRGVPPSAVLLLFPTLHAAALARERLLGALGARGEAIVCDTFHSLALTLLREQAAHSELPADVHIIDEASRAAILCAALDIKGRAARRLLADISQCKRHRQPPPAGGLLDQAYATYARQVQARGQIDFDDLLIRAAQLLEDVPAVQVHCRQRWRHVLVDDCQRMDDGQYRLLRALCGATRAHLCAALEREQGTGAEVLAHLRRDFPHGELVPWSRTHPFAHPKAAAPAPGTLQLHMALSEGAEAEFVTRTIVQACAGARVPGDFAVLFRTSRQEAVLHAALARVGLAVQSRGDGRLAADPAVQALMRLMGKETATGPLSDRLRRAAVRLQARTPEHYGTAVRRATDTLMPLACQWGEDMEGFARALPLLHGVDTLERHTQAVTLLSLQAARGLSFPVVFVVGVEEGFYPYGVGPWSKQVLASESRTMAFAMTRAADVLFLTASGQRVWRGRVRKRVASPFLQGIGADWVALPAMAPRPRTKSASAARTAQMALFQEA